MSITDKNSVFIVGAGVSAIFGMPLGGNLIEDISDQIKTEIKKTTRRDQSGTIYTRRIDYEALYRASQGEREYNKYPIASAEFLYLRSKEPGSTQAQIIEKVVVKLEKLSNLLDGQTSDTIDDFIVENDEVARLTKVCIATMFLKKLYETKNNSHAYRLADLSKRKFETNGQGLEPNFERNWVHHFINLVRKAVRNEEVSPDNKVKVISFNYDNIFEYVLDKQFRNTGYPYDTWNQYIQIIHPHGQCGLPKETIHNPAAIATEWANGIFVVNETKHNVSPEVIEDREKAKKWIKSSEEIYSLGFAFSGPNLKLLGLDPNETPKFDRLISYCNYDGNVGLRRSLSRFERKDFNRLSPSSQATADPLVLATVEIVEAEGERDNFMNCSDWFTLGYPGEPPS